MAKLKFFDVTLIFIISIVLILYALDIAYDNNEFWLFNEASNLSQGQLPFIDYFSHRLPLHQISLGSFFWLFEDTYLLARIFSIILTIISIILIFVTLKNQKYSFIFLILIFLNYNFFYSHALNLNYSLTSFLFSLSIFTFFYINSRNKYLIFFTLQILLYLNSYLLSPQLILLLILFFVYLIFIKDNRKIIVTFIFIVTLVLFFLFNVLSEGNFFYATWEYNLGQLSEMFKRNILSNNFDEYYERFIYQRKNEIKNIPIILLFIGLINFLLINNYKKIFLKIKNKEISNSLFMYLYLYLFIHGYFFALFFTGFDFFVTKSYCYLPCMYLSVIIFNKYFYYEIKKNENKIKFIVITTFIFSVFFNFSYNWHFIKFLEDKKIINSELKSLNANKTSHEKYTATFLPILDTNEIILDKHLSMELYSFLHDLNHKESIKKKLAHIHNFKKKIILKKYDFLIVGPRLKSEKNMSKVFGTKKKELIELIDFKYKSKQKVYTTTFGEVTIYVK
jgi:hypothetical protein